MVLLEQLYHSVFEEQFPLREITVNTLKRWHRRWLGNIYEYYQSWEQNKTEYIAAIHAGMAMDYGPMKHWVREALRRN